MSTPFKRILNKLGSFPVRKWYTKTIQDLAADLRTMLLNKSEVVLGGVVSNGASITASVLQIDTTALDSKLAGELKLQLAAQANADLFTTAGSIGQAVYGDGADASGISLASDEVAQVSVVAANSDGADGVTGENGAVILIAVVAGSAATYAAQTQPATDAEIDAALEASTGVHAATTGWVRLANYVWDENSASPTATLTVARDV